MRLRAGLALVRAIDAQTRETRSSSAKVVQLLREEALTPQASGPPGAGVRVSTASARPSVATLERLAALQLHLDGRLGDRAGVRARSARGAHRRPRRGCAPRGALDEALAAHLVEELRGTSAWFTLIQATLATSSRGRDGRASTPASRRRWKRCTAPGRRPPPSSPTTSARPSPCWAPTGSFTTACSRGVRTLLASPGQALVHFERALAAKERSRRSSRRGAVRPRPRAAGDARARRAGTCGNEPASLVRPLRRGGRHPPRGRRRCPSAPAVAAFGYTDAAELITRALTLVSPGSDEEGRLLAQQGWFSGFIEADYDRAQRDFRRALSIAERERRLVRRAADARQCGLRRRVPPPLATTASRGVTGDRAGREDGDPSTEIPASRAAVFALTATGGREQVHSLAAPGARARERCASAGGSRRRASATRLCPLRGRLVGAREMREVSLAADSRDPRHLALGAVLESTLGDDDAAAAYIARLREGGAGVIAAGADRRPRPARHGVPLSLAPRTTTSGWTSPLRRPGASSRSR